MVVHECSKPSTSPTHVYVIYFAVIDNKIDLRVYGGVFARARVRIYTLFKAKISRIFRNLHASLYRVID